MNKLSAISNPFSSNGTNNLVNQNDPQDIVVAKIPAYSLPIGSAIKFEFGGGITGNQESQNDKLQLIPHIPGVGNAAALTVFDKSLKQASNFKTEITIQSVADSSGNPKVTWMVRTSVGKDGQGYEEFATETSMGIGGEYEFHFFMAHIKSTQNSTITLKYCYAYSV